jgi:hypothetical protein
VPLVRAPQALCQSSIDLEPICAPRICPIVTPGIPPIATPMVPPIGATSCAPEQVFNGSTYEYRTVCH